MLLALVFLSHLTVVTVAQASEARLSFRCVLAIPPASDGSPSIDADGYTIPIPLELSAKTAEQIQSQNTAHASRITFRSNRGIQLGSGARALVIQFTTETTWTAARNGQPERLSFRLSSTPGGVEPSEFHLEGTDEHASRVEIPIRASLTLRFSIRCNSQATDPEVIESAIRSYLSPPSKSCGDGSVH